MADSRQRNVSGPGFDSVVISVWNRQE